ncbi:hypothetical protein VIGAN_11053300 [Vigna angularis var. angularis]|uniref:Uncharacterized protein n=1 Tax=Vigna angularis var. angularis TaxID=157739 RepID=A0A0S3T7U4_PHAAN|nr:hypothetical protein VIGAN_11053300 [Vigna angularis var. angularis]
MLPKYFPCLTHAFHVVCFFLEVSCWTTFLHSTFTVSHIQHSLLHSPKRELMEKREDIFSVVATAQGPRLLLFVVHTLLLQSSPLLHTLQLLDVSFLSSLPLGRCSKWDVVRSLNVTPPSWMLPTFICHLLPVCFSSFCCCNSSSTHGGREQLQAGLESSCWNGGGCWTLKLLSWHSP